MEVCKNGISIPELSEDLCKGKTKNTQCIIHSDAIPSLELNANSTQKQINDKLILVLNSMVVRITALETLVQDLELRIQTLETL
jgi:hypothetical protein